MIAVYLARSQVEMWMFVVCMSSAEVMSECANEIERVLVAG